MQVDIYIELSSRAPKIKKGYFGYVLACEIKGNTRTVEGFGKEENTTANKMALSACVQAMKRMKAPSEIVLHINNAHVRTGHDYIESWKAAGWKNSRGNPVANEEMWKELENLEKPHKVYVSGDLENEYSKWILTEIERRKRGEENER